MPVVVWVRLTFLSGMWSTSDEREVTGMQPFAILQTARLPSVHKERKAHG